MISKVIPTILAPGAYTDPISGMNLGSVYDINNPMMRGNNSFDWDMDLGKYVPHELTEEQLDVWDEAARPSTAIYGYRSTAGDDYHPSVEPATPRPTSSDEGFHWIVAADLRRGDLFSNPFRPHIMFPINSRFEGETDGYPYIRVEYIDVYDQDLPNLDWVPTELDESNPGSIMVQGFDLTPTDGLATVRLYPDEWIFIRDRPQHMGQITRSEGVSAGGESNRYRWFYDNDTYTYTLLNNLFFIGKNATTPTPSWRASTCTTRGANSTSTWPTTTSSRARGARRGRSRRDSNGSTRAR